MLRFNRFRPARRDPVLKGDSARAPRSRAQYWRDGFLVALPVAAVLLAHQFLFSPERGVEGIRYEVGEVASQEIRAPFDFEAPRALNELDAARRETGQRIEPVYRRDDDARRRTELNFADFFDALSVAARADSLPLSARVTAQQALRPGLEPSTLRVLLDAQRLERVRAALTEVFQAQIQQGIVDVFPTGTYQNVWVLDEELESDAEVAESEQLRGRRVPVGQLFLGYRFAEKLLDALRPRLSSPPELAAAVDVGDYFLLPNLIFDEPRTEERRQLAISQVPILKKYIKNERIVDSGMRINRDHLAVIEAMEAHSLAEERRRDRTFDAKVRGGRLVLMLLVMLGAARLVRQVDPRILTDRSRFALLNLLWLVFLALSALAFARPDWGGPAIVPVALLGMLSVILFGETTAYRVVAAGLLMILLAPEQVGPMILAWAGIGVASVRMLRRVRNRNQFYRALGVVATVALLSVVAAKFSVASGPEEALRQGLLAAASVVVCTALTLFFLPLLEATFGVTTELTLLELSDLNHPLLRRMSLESPGTFHHSQVVGTLAEAGSRVIGANSLLTRVGANFHDIGKMLKPRYFAENQGQSNPHDELTPQMSSLVIASHVKDGVELGREWGLPGSVLAFIPEHHGTSVMQYFYKKALEKDDGGAIKVDDFRYPGPKPQSKETAILMIADGAEASVRSLRRPTASRVREMVRKIIDQKMAEGELDECGITLSELARVRESIIPILVGIHHQRVAYPGQREHEEKKEQESREARARSRRSGSTVGANG